MKKNMNIVFCKPLFPNWEPLLKKLNIPFLSKRMIWSKTVFDPDKTHIPSSLEDTKFLNDYDIKRFCSTIEQFQLFDNHLSFPNYINSLHLAHLIPKVFSLSDIEFPCVLKPQKALFAGKRIKIINSLQQIKSVGYPYVLQELVSGDVEYSSHIACKDGRIIYQVTYYNKFSSNKTIKQGSSGTYFKATDLSHHFKELFRL